MSKIPACAGDYEECDICDGEPDSRYEEDREACIFRDRCVAFKLFLKDRYKKASEYLSYKDDSEFATPIKGYEHFIAMCDAQITKYGVEYGIPTENPGRPQHIRNRKSNKGYARQKQLRGIHGYRKRSKKKVLAIYNHFIMHLSENLVGHKLAQPGSVLMVGDLFVDNKIETSGWGLINCKGEHTTTYRIAYLRRNLNFSTIDVFFPLEYTSYTGIGKYTMDRLNPQPYTKSNFKSVCARLDMEGAALAAQTLAFFIKTDKIKLPKTADKLVY